MPVFILDITQNGVTDRRLIHAESPKAARDAFRPTIEVQRATTEQMALLLNAGVKLENAADLTLNKNLDSALNPDPDSNQLMDGDSILTTPNDGETMHPDGLTPVSSLEVGANAIDVQAPQHSSDKTEDPVIGM